MTVRAVILAAGRSSRFEDGHKLLTEIDGISIVRRVCLTLAASDIEDIVLVVSEASGPVARAAGEGRWRVVENAQAAEGLSTTLRCGLEHVGSDAYGILVALADMPGITTGLVKALLDQFAADQAAITFPISSDGRRGHPIIWPRQLLPELMTVSGDTGGKNILSKHQDLWRPVPWAMEGAFADIDTRADLQAFTVADQTTRLK